MPAPDAAGSARLSLRQIRH